MPLPFILGAIGWGLIGYAVGYAIGSALESIMGWVEEWFETGSNTTSYSEKRKYASLVKKKIDAGEFEKVDIGITNIGSLHAKGDQVIVNEFDEDLDVIKGTSYYDPEAAAEIRSSNKQIILI